MNAAPRKDRIWLTSAILSAVMILMPVAALFLMALGSSGGSWGHLISTVLPRALQTTALLLLGVGILTGVTGVITAWLVTMCRFPGRRLFDWALLIPLAVPTYIIAFAYVDVMAYSGPVQSTLRAIFGFRTARDYWFPEIRSLGGAIFVMSAVLYPYVYLSARASFLLQSASALDVGRTLGAGPLRLFLRVALPLSRPAIAAGIALALMECLNDIGAVTFFGVRTLTFSIYDTWLNRSNLAGAAQLACAMLIIVVILLALERRARRHLRFDSSRGKHHAPARYQLTGLRALLAISVCALPVVLGFIVPASMLAGQAFRRLEQAQDPAFLLAVRNSVVMALIASSLITGLAITLVYAARLHKSKLLYMSGRIASIGYAVPGTVLAVGILIPLASLDNTIDAMMKQMFGFGTGLLLIGSGTALVYAYLCRFLAVAHGQVEGGFGKISPNLDMAARTLGRGSTRILGEVHMPLLRPVLLSALLITFVDCMKELPATILLRPFNFNTLATSVYEAASREAFEEAALPALAIVLTGLVPVILLASTSARSFRQSISKRGLASTS
ncbi:Sulfate transport system permease protein CysW [Pannonibacter phragmitetus]|uniref:Sulfate transport system permease protein CysW n=1 Tax=Pannonibacter phragmitetus TaxID=121719 RepID=A0A378ZRG5_9HYPH|nr:iron ABC transporter permease [Pannonibacter phragmitetus]SUA99804.1 Sulfate transport system permease protein CysW [Pannonibacter phragmitetus]